METIILGLLSIAFGAFSFFGAKQRWGFFVRSGKYRSLARLFSENGARIFYMGLGIFIAAVGLCAALGSIFGLDFS